MKVSTKNHGVALLEVLIAFIIVAVSLSALYKLINIYLRDEINSSAHLGALYLAEGKLDDLRTFGSLSVSSGVPAFDSIATNSGGTITSGTVSSGNYTYNLTWTVSAAANNTSKTVIVSVVGTNNTESVLLFGSIPRVSTVNTARLTSGSTATSISPNIAYTPGSTPDVVAIDLGNGSKQETTKPLPTVSNSGGSVQVKFSTVTYNTSNNTQVLSDYETLSCSCSNSGTSADTLLPATPIQLSSGLLYWNLGSIVNKKTAAVADNQQPTLCNICCQNHYDGLTTTGGAFANYYNQLNQAALKYSYNGSTYTQIGTGTFIDSCRLLRINGYYKPMPDWNLVKLAVMNESFLTDSQNVAKYQAYVNYVVGTYINNLKNNSNTAISDFSTWLNSTYGVNTNITTTTTSTPTQLIARGIFVDILDKGSTWLSSINTNQTGYLAQVPFYDINMTLLSRWTTSSAGIATVADDTIKTLSATNSDYYGVYRRGYATPASSGVATITASAYQGDSSIAAYQYNKNALEAAISPFESNNGNSGSVLFTVSGSSGTSAVAITGKIYCYNLSTNGNKNSLTDCVQGNTDLLSSIKVQGSGATCQTGAEGTSGTGSNKYSYILYTCTVPSLPSTGATATISAVPSGFTSAPSSVSLYYPAGTTTPISGGCFNVYNSSINLSSLPLPTTCP